MKAGILPTSLNWATTNNPFGSSIVSPVRNQGSCGSCWAFVTTFAIESAVTLATKRYISLSEQELIDCDSTNKGCGGGDSYKAFEYVKQFGLGTSESYSYEEQVFNNLISSIFSLLFLLA